jgi:histone H3/H4
LGSFQEGWTVAEILVVQSKVREMIKGAGCSTSGDAVDALSNEVNRIIKRAVERTKANGRKTVKGSDI